MSRSLAVAALAALGIVAAAGAAAQSGDVAAKRAALEKLCAMQVLTVDDCARRRAALSGGGDMVSPAPAAPAFAAPAAEGGRVFTDADGRYSAIVPDGWNTSSNNGVATFSSGDAWATLVPSGANRPDAAVNDFVGQLRGSYPKLAQAQTGQPVIGGHQAVFVTFSGVNPKNQSVAVTVAGVQGPSGHVLVYMSSAPLAEIDNYSKALFAILKGVRFGGESR